MAGGAPAGWTVEHTELDVTFEASSVLVRSTLEVRFLGAGEDQPTPLVLDGIELELLEITLDGDEVESPSLEVGERTLRLDLGPRRGASLTTTCRPLARDPQDLGVVVQPGLINSHLEPTGLRRVTYCLDHPSQRSTYRTTLRASRAQFPSLWAGGNLLGERDLGDGRFERTFEDPVPKPTYLVSLVAGNFAERRRVCTLPNGQSVEVLLLAPPHLVDGGDYAFEVLEATMAYDLDHGGVAYDLDRLALVAVAGYPDATEYRGAMYFEPSTLLVDPSGSSDDDLLPILANVSHEYLHHTRGNRVGLASWGQLTVKEGLTVLAQNDLREQLDGPASRIAAVSFLRRVQFPEEGTLKVAVVPSDPPPATAMYNRTTYLKGAEIFRMLRLVAGEEAFTSAFSSFVEAFDLRPAEVADLVDRLKVAAPAVAADLDAVARWFSLVGRPVVEATVTSRGDRLAVHLERVDQLGDTEPVAIPVDLACLDAHGIVPSTVEGRASTEHRILLRGRAADVVLETTAGAVPSLLRGFSAPIDLRVNLADVDLGRILQHDPDPYAAWSAAEQLKARVVDAVRSESPRQADDPLAVLVGALRSRLEAGADPALLAELLAIPSEVALADREPVIDVDGTHAGVLRLSAGLGEALGEVLTQMVAGFVDQPAATTPVARAQRSMVDAALRLLGARGSSADWELIAGAVREGGSTVSTRALAVACSAGHPDLETLLAETEARWAEAPKLFDRWIRAQSAAPRPETIALVAQLVASPRYDRRDRSRVMAVWFPFCTLNRVAFHDRSGEGYRIFIDEVGELAEVNPGVVLRLVGDLLQFQRFDPQRQQLLRTQLERVRSFTGLGPFALSVVDQLLASP